MSSHEYEHVYFKSCALSRNYIIYVISHFYYFTITIFKIMHFILLHIKFDIDINNDELMKPHENIKKKLIIIGNVQQHGSQITNI